MDEQVGPAILAAARRLVVKHGFVAVTTNAIAEEAGVGKQTIYRRWPSKADLVLQAFLEHARAEVDRGSKGPIEERVQKFLQRTFDALEQTGPAIRSLMAHAQGDPKFRQAFRKQFIAPRRAKLHGMLTEAAQRGELRSDMSSGEADAAVIALYGAVWYQLLLDEPFDRRFTHVLARIVVRGLRARGTPTRPADGLSRVVAIADP